MIDKDGFRHNIGIIIANERGQLLWAKRVNRDAWQFPQGGMQQDEKPKDTLFRELYEEVGLKASQVHILGQTRNWLNYRLPKRMIRNTQPLCIGQKQLWFMLRLLVPDKEISFVTSNKPEFDHFRWVSYWFPLHEVVSFKKEVYRQALKELVPSLWPKALRQGTDPEF